MSDPRPPVAVGHVTLRARDLPGATTFWTALGLRKLVEGDGFAVLELRGGTHLILLPADDEIVPGTPVYFDLMVDDIDESWKRYTELGFEPSEVARGDIHDSFTLRDPSGYALTVNSSHASDQPV